MDRSRGKIDLRGEEKAQRRGGKKDDRRMSQRDEFVALTCGRAELGRGAHVTIVRLYRSLVKRVVRWADSLTRVKAEGQYSVTPISNQGVRLASFVSQNLRAVRQGSITSSF